MTKSLKRHYLAHFLPCMALVEFLDATMICLPYGNGGTLHDVICMLRQPQKYQMISSIGIEDSEIVAALVTIQVPAVPIARHSLGWNEWW